MDAMMLFVGEFAILHAGSGHEATFFSYLSRVGLYLIGFGGIALLMYWVLEAITVGRSEDLPPFEPENPK